MSFKTIISSSVIDLTNAKSESVKGKSGAGVLVFSRFGFFMGNALRAADPSRVLRSNVFVEMGVEGCVEGCGETGGASN